MGCSAHLPFSPFTYASTAAVAAWYAALASSGLGWLTKPPASPSSPPAAARVSCTMRLVRFGSCSFPATTRWFHVCMCVWRGERIDVGAHTHTPNPSRPMPTNTSHQPLPYPLRLPPRLRVLQQLPQQLVGRGGGQEVGHDRHELGQEGQRLVQVVVAVYIGVCSCACGWGVWALWP